ncbi:MAG: ion channel [Nitrospinaceae bacterium]
MFFYPINRILRKLRQPETRLLFVLGSIFLLMIVVFALMLSTYEKDMTFSDGLWTAYITLTTIGYGDISAATPEGRWTTVVTSMLGIGCFGVLTGIILERAMQRRMKKMKGEGNYTGNGHLIIVNVPSYGEITELLKELDHSPDFKDIPRVIVAAHLPNRDKELPEFLVRKIDAFIMGLPSASETLQRVNASQAKACVLTSCAADPAMDDTNTLTAGLIEKNWPQVVTVMTCSRAETLNNLNTFGIDGGISTTDLQMGLLVQELEDPGLYQVYRELSSNAGGNQIYISYSPVGSWEGDYQEFNIGSLKIAAIQLKLPVGVLGIQSMEGGQLRLNPENDLILTSTDHIIYMSRKRFDWLKNSGQILQQIFIGA